MARRTRVEKAWPGGPASAERFDPSEGAGTLEASEHYVRYLWAAGAVRGKTVLDAGCGTGYGSELLARAGAARVVGVDIDAESFPSSSGDETVDFTAADLRALPFSDREFEVVTCFEVIEHLDDRPAALSELKRVLSVDGLLLLSSPNRDVYPPGNPYHVFEYLPGELRDEVGEHFGNVALYRQDAWLASSLTAGGLSSDSIGEVDVRVHAARASADEGAPFWIVAASDAELPKIEDRSVLGDAFEVRWWHEQLAASTERAERAREELAGEKRGQLELQAEVEGLQAEAVASRDRLSKLQAVSEQELKRLQAELRGLGRALVKLESNRAQELEALREARDEVQHVQEQLAEAYADYYEAQRTIQSMHRTRVWRIGSAYWRFRNRVLRRGSS